MEDGMPCFSHRRSLCVNIKQLRVLMREYEMRCSKGVTDLLHCWRADIAEVKKTYCVDQGEAPRGGWLWPSLYKYCMYSTSCILIIVVVPGQHKVTYILWCQFNLLLPLSVTVFSVYIVLVLQGRVDLFYSKCEYSMSIKPSFLFFLSFFTTMLNLIQSTLIIHSTI